MSPPPDNQRSTSSKASPSGSAERNSSVAANSGTHRSIELEGVRVHNLQNIDLEIRRNSLTVVCGVSGSGKSSLAFDTLFAEGQRRYVETFSPYARQFLDRVERPDVDRIDGIPPGAPVMQMQELFRSMKGFGSNLLAKLDFADRDLKRFEGCGIDLFGAEIPWRINQNGVRDEDVTAIYELVASAQLLGAETYFTDVDDYEVFSAALSTGVRYMSGKIVGEETALPGKITPYSLLKIRQRWEPSEDEPDAIHI